MQFKAKSVLLALVAVFAVSAVAVASASATTPEFKPVPAKKKFTGTSGTIQWDAPGVREYITCASSSLTGELTGARTVGGVVLVATGCKGSSNEEITWCPVGSEGAKSGEIVSKALAGELGTVAKSEAASGVGLLLKRETKKEWFAFVGSCIQEAAVSGTVAAEVAVIGSKLATNKLVFPEDGSHTISTITLDSGKVEKPELQAGDAAFGTFGKDEVKFEEALEVT
jgi:hypothetical protein